ncbi:IS3 family transposase [Candidatus Stoquefichus massiliensis]|uniref:IS3 family transposase n=1 Tax=Candidatus Stoquefichus massiliensis TaxID=1470350 RepID=UPI001E30E790|nr:IS3 family transposase [Candidatus Stoquefichus massiliensis]
MHNELGYSVQWMCKHLNISRASYYKWYKRDVPQKEIDDISLSKTIEEYHERFHGILGYRRVTMFINRDLNENYSPKRVHRIMKILDIHSGIRRARHCCTAANKTDKKAENLLKRNFVASKPNEKWATDVTEFKVPHSNEKIYLSAFLDFYDRSIVSWVISDRNNNKLVFDTFNEAIKTNPLAKPLFHSDRGFQYTSPIFKNLLNKQGMIQSMSRVACCLDNGPTEALWGIIKAEMYELYDVHDKESLIAAITKYIHFYNYGRYQDRFDSKTPMEVRNEALKQEEPKVYPIAFNKRIEDYKENLKQINIKEKTASAVLAGV